MIWVEIRVGIEDISVRHFGIKVLNNLFQLKWFFIICPVNKKSFQQNILKTFRYSGYLEGRVCGVRRFRE